ncbi:hypothetical protein EU537_02830 [Candidatus Thorarchaeota archaeon]|nr:MAG: hypothetical protein EU537_02830 [Candidatus Thorarchaeota archaeon]
MGETYQLEDLIDRLLLIVTLNSTLVHFLISSQVEGHFDPDRVDSLTQGLIKTRSWMEEATKMEGVPSSTSNIMALIVKRLSQIENLLPRLSEKAKQLEAAETPAQEILSLLDDSSKLAVKMVQEDEDGQQVSLVKSEEEIPPEPYRRVDVEDDEFGLIGQTERLIKQYSKRCHVLLPTFWLEVIRQIHKYRSESPYIGDAIETPSKVIARIVRGLLTEAPGARLLQDLSKQRSQENILNATEMERIERAVARYFHGLEGILSNKEPNVTEKINEAHSALDGFGWGGPELEKRLIKRIHQRCEEALDNAESVTDESRQVVYAEITKMLCKLQHAILAEPRLREILALMKP